MIRSSTILRHTLLAISLLAMAGCATNFEADVTRFQQLPKPSGETIEIVPKNPKDAGNLSFKHYAQLIGDRLGTLGYKPPQPGTPSTLIATISYGVMPGPVPADVRRRPPVTIGIGVGTGGRHSAFGLGVETGVGTARPTTPATNRYLELVITRRSDGHELYQGKATSLGETASVDPVMPLLIDALFKDFPGKSGTTTHVELGPEPKPAG